MEAEVEAHRGRLGRSKGAKKAVNSEIMPCDQIGKIMSLLQTHSLTHFRRCHPAPVRLASLPPLRKSLPPLQSTPLRF